jgi:hypothetical protein
MPTKRQQLQTLLPALVFAAIVLAINGHWFRVPIFEASDFAANSIQVYHAKLLREMLGNYSRWHFHHPGPVFFYLFAAGEYLFVDWLRIVPAPANAHLLTVVLVNTALLFGSIEIFARHCPGRLFRPLALWAAVLLIYAVNHTVPVSVLISLWMPYVALFAFLFFTAACASVAAGKIGHLPLMALGAMTMVHLHVAQVLFAGVMSLAACAAALAGEFRVLGWKRTLRDHAKAITLSAGIVAVFLLPILLELVLHKPNNLDWVRAYLAKYPNPNRGLVAAGRYLLTFLTFGTESSEGLMTHIPAAELLSQAAAKPYVMTFWGIAAAGLGGAIVLARRNPKIFSRFTATVLVECALIVALFLYWANRITGAMYNFNGFFIYSLPLTGLFLAVGMISAGTSRLPQRAWLVWLAPFLTMVAVAGSFRNPDMGSAAMKRLSDELRSPDTIELTFERRDWPTAVGVANQLVRRQQPFCVQDDWGFMFGYEYVCRPSMAPRKVEITGRW